jgi:hypothetical protein
MHVPDKYADSLSLTDKILFVLSVIQKGSADEVAMEIMELQGTSSEDGVADLTDETANELDRLCEEGVITRVKEHRQKVRFALTL